MRKILLVILMSVCLLWAIPAFADVTIGLPADASTGNAFPFGAVYDGEYQQVYSSTQFSGPITITNLEFFDTVYGSGATSLPTGIWTISLSTTPADWNTLSTTFASNIGSNNTTVFDGNISQPWAFGDTLSITLSTPFLYNPADGNLLMDVVASGVTVPSAPVYFDTNGDNGGGENGDTFLGRDYINGGVGPTDTSGTVNSGYGLVTEFSTSASTVPEPCTLILLGSGLAGLAAYRRRRSRG